MISSNEFVLDIQEAKQKWPERDIGLAKNLTNKRFGKLTPLYRTDNFGNITAWVCQCDCGKIKPIRASELTQSKKPQRSCGCEAHKRAKNFGNFSARDLTNQKFGSLQVINKIGVNKYNYIIWHCKCDCGNECDVLSRELLSGNAKSCGCRKSTQPETDIENLLIKYNIKYIREYTFNDLNDKFPLRFDFAIFNNDSLVCLIEYQGQQHTDKHNSWYSETLAKHDQMKKDYCHNKKLDLFEIQYYNNIKDKLIEILMEEGVLIWDQIMEF